MIKAVPALLTVSLLSSISLAAPPAPTDQGVIIEESQASETQVEKASAGEKAKGEEPKNSDENQELTSKIAELQTEIRSLRGMLEKLGDPKKEHEQLDAEIKMLQAENTALADRVKTLESDKDKLTQRLNSVEGINARLQERLANLETSEPQEQTVAKPAFVKSAVRFYNYEGRPVKMNVNGVWHTIKEGENQIWVPYAPVHVYRYNGAEPRTFWKWKPHMDGFIMEFDVGTPPAK